ncbi:MAG: PadR family transcriptional regulator [Alphaproteobacteria bacterium]
MGYDSIGELEMMIMLAVLRLGTNAYGITIRDELAKRGGRSRSFGTIYTTLDRLSEKGFVTSRLGDPTAERGGRAKKFFELTTKGRITLEATVNSRRSLENGLGFKNPALHGAAQ